MSQFDELLERIRSEAASEGPTGTADLESLQARFDLAVDLVTRRRAIGMTQTQLATASGIGQSVISRIERGDANPTVKTVSTLARALHARLTLAVRAG